TSQGEMALDGYRDLGHVRATPGAYWLSPLSGALSLRQSRHRAVLAVAEHVESSGGYQPYQCASSSQNPRDLRVDPCGASGRDDRAYHAVGYTTQSDHRERGPFQPRSHSAATPITKSRPPDHRDPRTRVPEPDKRKNQQPFG